MNPDDVLMYTGISIRSVERIIAYFKHNQDVLVWKQSIKERKRKLGEVELEVSALLRACHILNRYP